MATGHMAFPGATTGVVMEAIVNLTREPLHHLVSYDGLELERIVIMALQKDRNLRYETAADLYSDLLAYKMAVRPAPLIGGHKLKRDTNPAQSSTSSSSRTLSSAGTGLLFERTGA